MRYHRMRTSALVQQRARELRRQMTAAEHALWECLRERRLDGLSSAVNTRWGPLWPISIAPQERLVVEVDGGIHGERRERDEARTAHLEAQGYRVLRVANEDVHDRLDEVMRIIREAVRGTLFQVSEREATGKGSDEEI